MPEHDRGRGLGAGANTPYSSPQLFKKNKKGFCRKGNSMNHPEFKPTIIFDNTVFEVGNPIKIVTVCGSEFCGLLVKIEKDYIDIRKNDDIGIYFYDQISHMELADISE